MSACATATSREGVASKYVPIVFATGPHDGDVATVDLTWSFSSPSDQVVLSRADGVIVGGLGAGDGASFSLEPGPVRPRSSCSASTTSASVPTISCSSSC